MQEAGRVESKLDWIGDALQHIRQSYVLDGWNTAKGEPVGNENWDVYLDLDASNGLETRYLRGDVVDELFARVDQGTTPKAYWTLLDHQGSVRDVIGATGALKASARYDGYGNVTERTTGVGDPLPEEDFGYLGRYGWTGRERDAETGLQHNRARYYDPRTGRWLSLDPLGFAAGDANLYRYVGNAPTVGTDPSGLKLFYKKDGKNFIKLPLTNIKVTQPTAKYLKDNGLPEYTEKKWLDLAKIVTKQLDESKFVFGFENEKQAASYIKFLTWNVIFAKQLQQRRHEFISGNKTLADFPKSKFWELGMVEIETAGMFKVKINGLMLRKGALPADGLLEFFTKDKAASFDCGTFQSLVARRSLLEVLGKAEYNRRYTMVGIAGAQVANDPFPFVGLKIAIEPPISGMFVRFSFPISKGDGWDNENTIATPGKTYIGHPFAKPLSKAEMIRAIEEEADRSGTKPDLVSSIDYQTLPK